MESHTHPPPAFTPRSPQPLPIQNQPQDQQRHQHRRDRSCRLSLIWHFLSLGPVTKPQTQNNGLNRTPSQPPVSHFPAAPPSPSHPPVLDLQHDVAPRLPVGRESEHTHSPVPEAIVSAAEKGMVGENLLGCLDGISSLEVEGGEKMLAGDGEGRGDTRPLHTTAIHITLTVRRYVCMSV
ncbi:hypothetical protein SVAN01_01443 [Stagonosporopsis vannaccii]|nr:hypothetical protein SVAN01_01443 [Stagonosporopsis vannaccii]